MSHIRDLAPKSTKVSKHMNNKRINTLLYGVILINLTYIGGNISSTESNDNIRIWKAWTVIARLSKIWKPDVFDRMKLAIYQTVAVLVLSYGCTTRTVSEAIKEKC